MTSGPRTEWVTDLVLPGERLSRLIRLPRLGIDHWPAVAAAHRERHGARPGERPEQVTLVAACSALQVELLAHDLTEPTLPGMPPGSWTKQLPAWVAQSLPSSLLRLLFQAAAELDVALLSWPVPPATTTAELVVRHTLLHLTESLAPQTGLEVDRQPLALSLQIARSPGELLWEDATKVLPSDLVEQHARGLELFDPRNWGCPVHEPQRDPRIVFHRRRPASGPDSQLGGPVVLEFWGDPALGASAAQSGAVRAARYSRRPTLQRFIPTGRPTDTNDFAVWLRDRCTAEVRLIWQPLLGARRRETTVLLQGLEVDEQGLVWVLVIWAGSVLAVPLGAIVEVELGRGCRERRS